MSSPVRRRIAFVLMGLGLACSDTRSVSLGELAGARRATPASVDMGAPRSSSPADTGGEAAPARAVNEQDGAPARAREDAGAVDSTGPLPAPRPAMPPAIGVEPPLDVGRAPSAPAGVGDDDDLKGADDDEREYESKAEDDDDDDQNARKDADEAEEEAREDDDDDDPRSDER